MSNEIIAPAGAIGGTAYFLLWRLSDGQIYNTAGAAFEAYSAGNYADYDNALAEAGASGTFIGSMPTAARGNYGFEARMRAGGSPAQSDLPFSAATIKWTGSAEEGVLDVDSDGAGEANLTKLLGTAYTAGAIPAAVAGAVGGLFIAGTNALLTVTGAVALNSTLTVSGATTFGSIAATTITTSGVVTLHSLTVSNNVVFAAGFAVSASVTFNSFTVSNATTLTGAVSLGSTLSVAGTVTLNALTVTNATTLSGAVALGSTLTVAGTSTFAAIAATTITTSGTVTLNALTVTNATTLSGAVSLGSTLTVAGLTTLAAVSATTITTSGIVTFNALTVTNATTLSGAVSLGSTLTVAGTSTFAAIAASTITTSGAVTFNSLVVTTTTTLTGIVSLGGAVGIAGTVTFNAFVVSTTTTLTGVVLATNAGNDIRGVQATVTDKTGFKLASDGLALVTAWTVDITGNLIGNLTGTIGGFTAGAEADIRSALGLTTSNLDVQLAGLASDIGLIPEASENATAIENIVIETGFSLKQSLQIIAAAVAGLVSGGPGTPVFVALDGVTTRISGVADSSGNRTVATYSV